MKKIKLLPGIMIMILCFTAFPVICHADTVTVPYGNSDTIVQGDPRNGGNYSRTDIIYLPGGATSYEGLSANGITAGDNIDISGIEYKQITTSYGNTGMATVTVTPACFSGVPTDMDAYQITYLSALQSYGLTVDPATGQIVSVQQP